MKLILQSATYLIFSLSILLLSGCNSRGDYWNSNTGALRYNRAGKPLWESEENPRMVHTEDEFSGPAEEEFIALADEDLHKAFIDNVTPQPKLTPGESGSPLPALCDYRKPDTSSTFKTIYFDTDVHIIRRETSKQALQKIANFMKRNQKLYVYVEGNCDERGSEAYNQALGTRRANSVRQYLINLGVNSERIHTISYGKEKPATGGHNPESWQKNRRSDFKIYTLR